MDGMSQVVSGRLTEEAFGKLAAYAASHGQTAGAAAKGIQEAFLTAPPPPPPPPGPDPGEVAELRRRLEELAGREDGTRRYVGDLAWRTNQVQDAVNRIAALLSMALQMPPPVPFPPFPAPPWRAGTTVQVQVQAEEPREE